jgi:nitrate reductase NapA
MPNAYVEMHPDDAKDLGIQNGEMVTVETRRGSLQLPAWIEGRGKTQRKNLFVPFFDERLLINDLTLDEVDPFSKQPDYKKAAAKVYKTRKEGV